MRRTTAGNEAWKRFLGFVGCLLFSAGLALGGDPGKPPADDDEAAVKTALTAFQGSYRGDDAARTKAIEALGHTRHPRVFAALQGILAGTENDALKVAAAHALGNYHDRRVAPLLKKGFEANKKKPEVIAAVFEALGDAGDPASTEVLRKRLDSHGTSFDEANLAVLEAAVAAFAQLPDRESVGYLIRYGETLNATVVSNEGAREGRAGPLPPGVVRLDQEQLPRVQKLMDHVRGALKTLTEQDLEAEGKERVFQPYRKWWRDHEKTWKPPEPE